MKMAIEKAKEAYMLNEVPVGCVVTHNGELVSAVHNTVIRDNSVIKHAEINAIEEAISRLGTKDLKNCDMYVTLEPCPMCAGAIINSKIKRVYIGAMEPKSGCFGSKLDFTKAGFNHTPEIYYGICEVECKELLQTFFRELR